MHFGQGLGHHLHAVLYVLKRSACHVCLIRLEFAQEMGGIYC